MVKQVFTISLDPDVKNRALEILQARGSNLSWFVELKLKELINEVDVNHDAKVWEEIARTHIFLKSLEEKKKRKVEEKKDGGAQKD